MSAGGEPSALSCLVRRPFSLGGLLRFRLLVPIAEASVETACRHLAFVAPSSRHDSLRHSPR